MTFKSPMWVHRRGAVYGVLTLILSGLTAVSKPRAALAELGAVSTTAGPAEVSPGLFVHRGVHAIANAENGGDIANLTFIVGRDSVAVVDTGGCAHIGRALMSAIKDVTSKPVRYVINTHMHPDHVLGNAEFETADTAFIAHHKMARALGARAERYLSRAKEQLGDAGFEGTKIVYPTRPIDAVTTLDLGGRDLILSPRPTAHTDNDMTVFDTQSGTLISGDLVFSEHIPTLDGSIRGWLTLIDVLRQEKAERVVPGHGPASMAWPDASVALQRYLAVVATDVRAAIKDGKTLSEATETAGQSERDKWRLFDEHHVRNVTAAFAELEWE